jgi:hypothetical protein
LGTPASLDVRALQFMPLSVRRQLEIIYNDQDDCQLC